MLVNGFAHPHEVPGKHRNKVHPVPEYRRANRWRQKPSKQEFERVRILSCD
jgi:hypothetical protein